jgi:hypothetical protein
MTDTYEHIADLFMTSLTARAWGGTREQFIAQLKAKWPTEAEVRAAFEARIERANAFAEQARRDAGARGMRVVGIAYRIDESKKT